MHTRRSTIVLDWLLSLKKKKTEEEDPVIYRACFENQRIGLDYWL